MKLQTFPLFLFTNKKHLKIKNQLENGVFSRKKKWWKSRNYEQSVVNLSPPILIPPLILSENMTISWKIIHLLCSAFAHEHRFGDHNFGATLYMYAHFGKRLNTTVQATLRQPWTSVPCCDELENGMACPVRLVRQSCSSKNILQFKPLFKPLTSSFASHNML